MNKMMIALWLAMMLSLPGLYSEVVYTAEDQQVFERYVAYIDPWQSADADTLLEKTAFFFLDSPYVAHTLEREGEECLVVNLREFDCTTYVETVIALVRSVCSGKPDFYSFVSELQQVRYRHGKPDGYASRLHYMVDWCYENETKGLVKNISATLGGVQEKKTIDFMTSHRNAYRQLKHSDQLWREMREVEDRINARGGFYYLSKKDIYSNASRIPHLSLLAFTTSITGLDVTHTGFALHSEGKVTFIHASSARKKVVVDSKSLIDYCLNQSTCTGVVVVEVASFVG